VCVCVRVCVCVQQCASMRANLSCACVWEKGRTGRLRWRCCSASGRDGAQRGTSTCRQRDASICKHRKVQKHREVQARAGTRRCRGATMRKHREACASTERQQRGTRKHREARASTERHVQAQRGTCKHREARRHMHAQGCAGWLCLLAVGEHGKAGGGRAFDGPDNVANCWLGMQCRPVISSCTPMVKRLCRMCNTCYILLKTMPFVRCRGCCGAFCEVQRAAWCLLQGAGWHGCTMNLLGYQRQQPQEQKRTWMCQGVQAGPLCCALRRSTRPCRRHGGWGKTADIARPHARTSAPNQAGSAPGHGQQLDHMVCCCNKRTHMHIKTKPEKHTCTHLSKCTHMHTCTHRQV